MSLDEQESVAFEALLDELRRSRGFDFSGYKRASLMRRVSKRLQMVGVHGYASYVAYLDGHPEEFGHLFDTILINVTAFFRDHSSWESLQAQIIPRLLAAKRADEPIRLWSAGCSSGEEAYTLAMVMAEAMGIDQFRDRVKIYATDIDDEALARARQAVYTHKEVEPIPAELLGKYFESQSNNNRLTFLKDLRRSVIFGRHDLIQDAPISRIDLLTCRNTLMYFNTETQARILDRFHFALNARGYLFLGKAETLLTYNNTFVPVDLKRRIFAKISKGNLRDRLLVMARTGGDEAVNHLVGHVRIREAGFEASPVAQLVVDFGGQLVLANERARSLFSLAPSDLDRPLQDLQLSYRPADLRSSLDRAYAERKPIALADVEWPNNGEISYLEVDVVPLVDAAGALLGATITFFDMTSVKRLRDELENTNRELETAYEELQSTNEELETTNEELQSTVEELETTNEELQSTNEELETMNEELQSTNEELETVNEELHERSDEVRLVNVFLESILSSLRGGVAVVDADFLIHVWNSNAEDLWGVRGDEVRGKNLLNLDIGLPVDQLKPLLRACLAGDSGFREITLDATNRRGKPIRCKVTCTPMIGDGVARVILLMEEQTPAIAVDGEPAWSADGRRGESADGQQEAGTDDRPRSEAAGPPSLGDDEEDRR
jgi:two-component system CheB/CheR fusion protein